MIEFLISKGADLNPSRYSPLVGATANGHLDALKLLLAKGAGAEDRRGGYETSIREALAGDSKQVVALLRKHGISTDSDFWDAVLDANLPKLKTLVSENSELVTDSYSQSRRTALMWSSILGNTKTAEFLIDAGSVVNSRDRVGRTPLQFAAQFGHREIVELLLLLRGANVNAWSSFGGTALLQAIDNGHEDIAELLRRHGAANW